MYLWVYGTTCGSPLYSVTHLHMANFSLNTTFFWKPSLLHLLSLLGVSTLSSSIYLKTALG